MTVCTFIGDKQIYRASLDMDIEIAIESVLLSETKVVFLVSGLSEFERYCSDTVRRLRRFYSHLDIRLALVLPYTDHPFDMHYSHYSRYYDEIIYPGELCEAPENTAVEAGSRYMIDQSDEVIACVYQTSGTAFELLKYAQIRGKRIINFPDIGKKVRYKK